MDVKKSNRGPDPQSLADFAEAADERDEEIDHLRAALKPFAETEVVAGIAWPPSVPTPDDFRRARDVYERHRGTET